ncbi:hypothetical protein BKI52_32270 [marine bacterium AO1-C]|nr:hypothetical protein BKI52_32270 [marine bacterium AO1-C]
MKNTKTSLPHFANYRRVLVLAVIVLISMYSCISQNAEDDPNPQNSNNGPSCANAPSLTLNEAQSTSCGQSTGSITVSGSGGSGTLTYSLDGQAFQATGTFSNLKNGTYTVTVKDGTGCTNTLNITVDLTDETSLANDVAPIIQTNCAISGCHVSGAQNPNLSDKANIIDRAERILARTSERTMPPSSSGKSLTAQQIELIRCWVDAGAKDN